MVRKEVNRLAEFPSHIAEFLDRGVCAFRRVLYASCAESIDLNLTRVDEYKQRHRRYRSLWQEMSDLAGASKER
jgi:hypothetical protein